MVFPAGVASPGNRRPLEPPRGRDRAGVRSSGTPLTLSPGHPEPRTAEDPPAGAPRGPLEGPDSGAAVRQESSWIRESCWLEARFPPAGRRLPGDLGPARPASEPQFPRTVSCLEACASRKRGGEPRVGPSVCFGVGAAAAPRLKVEGSVSKVEASAEMPAQPERQPGAG